MLKRMQCQDPFSSMVDSRNSRPRRMLSRPALASSAEVAALLGRRACRGEGGRSGGAGSWSVLRRNASDARAGFCRLPFLRAELAARWKHQMRRGIGFIVHVNRMVFVQRYAELVFDCFLGVGEKTRAKLGNLLLLSARGILLRECVFSSMFTTLTSSGRAGSSGRKTRTSPAIMAGSQILSVKGRTIVHLRGKAASRLTRKCSSPGWPCCPRSPKVPCTTSRDTTPRGVSFAILLDVHPGLPSRFVDRSSSPISLRDSVPDEQPIESSHPVCVIRLWTACRFRR